MDKNYYENQLEKWREVLKIGAESSGIVLHGGDLLHTYASPLSLLFDLTNIHHESDSDVWVNPGNHDLSGATVDTLYRSGLGLLAASRVVNMPNPDLCHVNPVTIDQSSSDPVVWLKSRPFQLQYPDDYYWIKDKVPGAVYIVMAHDMLTTRPVPFPHKLIQELKTNADIVLCSHWHSKFCEKLGNTWFVNAGPLDAQTVVERHIKPSVAMLRIDKQGVSVSLQALNTTGYEEVELRDEEVKDLGLADGFIQQIQQSSLADGADLETAIRVVSKESGYSDVLTDRVLKRLKDSQVCVEG